jgi:polysaccharide pyruvyl transferase WcaK-like protein
MTILFCVRPATRNIGNDIIGRATTELLYATFGEDVGIVNIPALKGQQFGGLTASQVYDMNRFADGVVLGGGNLFENGQVTVDPQAFAALRVPLFLIGLSHGRIYGRHDSMVERTDEMPEQTIRCLVEKAASALVRDTSTQARLQPLTRREIVLGGCPTLFMPPSPADVARNGPVLVSVRHPGRMSVPPAIQWRIAEDVRRLIEMLRAEVTTDVVLVCHDYADIEFASAFHEARMIYFDDVDHYMAALRRSRLSVSYRLHAFLPCLAFGTPAIHISYDERGKSMLDTAGMAAWDVDLMKSGDVVDEVLARVRNLDRYFELRDAAKARIEAMHQTSLSALRGFAQAVNAYQPTRGRAEHD